MTTLANLASKDGLIALTGINSSEAEQKAGKNEHLRAFEVRFPKRPAKEGGDKQDGKISLIGKSSLFKPATGPKPEQYQRLLRLSPPQRNPAGAKRIGVACTGLAKHPSQMIVFDASRVPAKPSEIINPLLLDDEVADVDISVVSPSEFSIVWCSDYNVFEQTVTYDFQTRKSSLTPTGPRRMHEIRNKDASGKTRTRPKYRSVRFLTDHHVLLLANSANKSGAELFIMHVYPTGPAAVLFHKVLPSHIKQAVGMDVCALDSDEIGSRQFVVAIAGQDISIEVYTINYVRQTDTFTPFKSFTTLREVHPLQMTSIRFAPFFPPPPAKEGARVPAQYIRLASVSMGNTVLVDTFSIQTLDSKKDSRYVLSHPSTEKWTKISFSVLIPFLVLIMAVLLQSVFFPQHSQMTLNHLPGPVRSVFDNFPIRRLQVEASVDKVTHSLRDILKSHSSEGASSKAVVLRGGTTDLGLEVVHDTEEYLKKDTSAKRWEQLQEHEKHRWREALIRAGQWTVDEGESVLKGILFSSYAGIVGQVAGEAIGNI